MTDYRELIKSTLAAPMGDIIASVGQGVASAQAALDEGSLATLLDIYSEGGDEKIQLLRDIGYQPTFYALPETTGELQIALTVGQSSHSTSTPVSPAVPPAPSSASRMATSSVAATPDRMAARPASAVTSSTAARALPMKSALKAAPRTRVYGTPVDANYTNRFNFNASASAKLTFKIVPVPPPDGAELLRVVPALTGQGVVEARENLAQFNLELTLPADTDVATAGASLITAQDPAPGTILRADDAVLVSVR